MHSYVATNIHLWQTLFWICFIYKKKLNDCFSVHEVSLIFHQYKHLPWKHAYL